MNDFELIFYFSLCCCFEQFIDIQKYEDDFQKNCLSNNQSQYFNFQRNFKRSSAAYQTMEVFDSFPSKNNQKQNHKKQLQFILNHDRELESSEEDSSETLKKVRINSDFNPNFLMHSQKSINSESEQEEEFQSELQLRQKSVQSQNIQKLTNQSFSISQTLTNESVKQTIEKGYQNYGYVDLNKPYRVSFKMVTSISPTGQKIKELVRIVTPVPQNQLKQGQQPFPSLVPFQTVKSKRIPISRNPSRQSSAANHGVLTKKKSSEIIESQSSEEEWSAQSNYKISKKSEPKNCITVRARKKKYIDVVSISSSHSQCHQITNSNEIMQIKKSKPSKFSKKKSNKPNLINDQEYSSQVQQKGIKKRNKKYQLKLTKIKPKKVQILRKQKYEEESFDLSDSCKNTKNHCKLKKLKQSPPKPKKKQLIPQKKVKKIKKNTDNLKLVSNKNAKKKPKAGGSSSQSQISEKCLTNNKPFIITKIEKKILQNCEDSQQRAPKENKKILKEQKKKANKQKEQQKIKPRKYSRERSIDSKKPQKLEKEKDKKSDKEKPDDERKQIKSIHKQKESEQQKQKKLQNQLKALSKLITVSENSIAVQKEKEKDNFEKCFIEKNNFQSQSEFKNNKSIVSQENQNFQRNKDQLDKKYNEICPRNVNERKPFERYQKSLAPETLNPNLKKTNDSDKYFESLFINDQGKGFQNRMASQSLDRNFGYSDFFRYDQHHNSQNPDWFNDVFNINDAPRQNLWLMSQPDELFPAMVEDNNQSFQNQIDQQKQDCMDMLFEPLFSDDQPQESEKVQQPNKKEKSSQKQMLKQASNSKKDVSQLDGDAKKIQNSGEDDVINIQKSNTTNGAIGEMIFTFTENGYFGDKLIQQENQSESKHQILENIYQENQSPRFIHINKVQPEAEDQRQHLTDNSESQFEQNSEEQSCYLCVSVEQSEQGSEQGELIIVQKLCTRSKTQIIRDGRKKAKLQTKVQQIEKQLQKQLCENIAEELQEGEMSLQRIFKFQNQEGQLETQWGRNHHLLKSIVQLDKKQKIHPQVKFERNFNEFNRFQHSKKDYLKKESKKEFKQKNKYGNSEDKGIDVDRILQQYFQRISRLSNSEQYAQSFRKDSEAIKLCHNQLNMNKLEIFDPIKSQLNEGKANAICKDKCKSKIDEMSQGQMSSFENLNSFEEIQQGKIIPDDRLSNRQEVNMTGEYIIKGKNKWGKIMERSINSPRENHQLVRTPQDKFNEQKICFRDDSISSVNNSQGPFSFLSRSHQQKTSKVSHDKSNVETRTPKSCVQTKKQDKSEYKPYFPKAKPIFKVNQTSKNAFQQEFERLQNLFDAIKKEQKRLDEESKCKIINIEISSESQQLNESLHKHKQQQQQYDSFCLELDQLEKQLDFLNNN